jgi:hypothetical protein
MLLCAREREWAFAPSRRRRAATERPQTLAPPPRSSSALRRRPRGLWRPRGVQGRRRRDRFSLARAGRGMAGAAVSPLCGSSLAPASPWLAVAGGHGSGPVSPGSSGCAARARVCAWARARGSVAATDGGQHVRRWLWQAWEVVATAGAGRKGDLRLDSSAASLSRLHPCAGNPIGTPASPLPPPMPAPSPPPTFIPSA